jgi:AraC-like DNA-binding protein
MTEYRHAKAVLQLHNAGMSMLAIAKLLNLSIDQVANVIAHYS